MHDRLQTTLRQLRLSGLSQDARRCGCKKRPAISVSSHAEFLELILQDEDLASATTNGKSARLHQDLPRSANSSRWTNSIGRSIRRCRASTSSST